MQAPAPLLPDNPPTGLTEPHIAEYTALTNRMTYWIYIQYVMYAIAGAAFGAILGFAPESIKPYQGWMLLFTLVATGWALLQSQDEILTTAIYIEGSLKPFVQGPPRADRPPTWEWERFRILRRGRGREPRKIVVPEFFPKWVVRPLVRIVNALIKFEGQSGVLPLVLVGAIGALALIVIRFQEALHDPKLLPYRARFFVFNVVWLIICVYMMMMVLAKGVYNTGLRAELDEVAQGTPTPQNELVK
jgi:hypothetical protein